MSSLADKTYIENSEFIRPWGIYNNLISSSKYLSKIIRVRPHQKLSLQSHKYRSEHWVVLEGTANIIKGDTTYELTVGQSIDIDKEEKHSLQNMSDDELVILEVQFGEILSEEDIIRYEDIYGRI